MLKQARVEDVSKSRITRLHGHIVVVTHYYPRYLKSKLIHEYARSLAPKKELLTEFKETEAEVGDHDQGFEVMDYESKFTLGPEGLDALARLSELAKEKDVYLVCHCAIGQRCHRELLLLAAKHLYQAPISRVRMEYPTFSGRLSSGDAFETDAS